MLAEAPQLAELVAGLSHDTSASVALALPEVTLAATIVLGLAARVPRVLRGIDPVLIALPGAMAALWLAIGEARGGLAAVPHAELFGGMLKHDALGVYSRVLLILAAALVLCLSRLTGLASRFDGQDFFALLLGATLGMCVMVRANHLMTVVLGVEMASVPSYVLAGAVKGRRKSSEAALKYSVYGAAAAGVLLYGVSLAVGVLGTAHLPSLGRQLAALDVGVLAGDPERRGIVLVLVLAAVAMFAGIAFKLSAFPFHSWAPDVLSGAPAEVGAFLSVASKAAAVVLAIRLAAAVVSPTAADAAAAMRVPELDAHLVAIPAAPPLAPIRDFLVAMIATAATATATLGNFAAIGQRDAKRMLAYSTIAHAGYLMMPIAAAVQLAGADPAAAEEAVAAVLLYLGSYLFLNLSAFAVVAVLRGPLRSEAIEDYAGLVLRSPVAGAALVSAMLGLLGLPPLVGFWGKFAALRTLASAGGPWMSLMLLAAIANTAVSMVYYLRVTRTALFDPPRAEHGADSAPAAVPRLPAIGIGRGPAALLAVVAAPIVVLGVTPQWLASLAEAAARGLFTG